MLEKIFLNTSMDPDSCKMQLFHIARPDIEHPGINRFAVNAEPPPLTQQFQPMPPIEHRMDSRTLNPKVRIGNCETKPLE